MRTHPLHFILATLTAVSMLTACDEGEDPVTCEGDEDCDDKMDEPEGDEDDGEASDAAESAPPAEEGGTPGPVPAECEALCACVEGLGGNLEGACAQKCINSMNDADPNDRAQCVEGVSDAGFMDCAVECEAMADGT